MMSQRLVPLACAVAVAPFAALVLGGGRTGAITPPTQSCAYDPASGKPNPLGDRAALTIEETGGNTVFTYQEVPSRVNRGPSVVVVAPKREITLENTSLEAAKQILLNNPAFYNDLIGYESATGFGVVSASLSCWVNDLGGPPPAQATLPARQVPATVGPIAPREVPENPAVAPANPAGETSPSAAVAPPPPPVLPTPSPATTPRVTVPAPSNTVAAASPRQTNINLTSLPDGNYRLWSGRAQRQPVSDATLLKDGGALFIFNKTGDRITGNFAYIDSEDTFCVTGQANNSTVSGFAFPYSNEALDLGESFRALGPADFLKARRTRVVNNRPFYSSALLDLSSFSQINLGPILPPPSCQS